MSLDLLYADSVGFLEKFSNFAVQGNNLNFQKKVGEYTKISNNSINVDKMKLSASPYSFIHY